MGWTSTEKPRGEKIGDFFKRHALRWDDSGPIKYAVLDSALVNLSEFYQNCA